jgi:CheY-like chemotaxis protein
MPGLTGLEIAETIHARNRVTPIMMISGSGEAPDERRAEQAGLVFPSQAVRLRAG